jgi:BioD-like phosphotransacetylase family protein
VSYLNIDDREKANSKLKDVHLLKSLQLQIKQGEYSVTALIEILSKISADIAISQAFRFLSQKCDHRQLQAILYEYTQMSKNNEIGILCGYLIDRTLSVMDLSLNECDYF